MFLYSVLKYNIKIFMKNRGESGLVVFVPTKTVSSYGPLSRSSPFGHVYLYISNAPAQVDSDASKMMACVDRATRYERDGDVMSSIEVHEFSM
jgi:hypothetical protein